MIEPLKKYSTGFIGRVKTFIKNSEGVEQFFDNNSNGTDKSQSQQFKKHYFKKTYDQAVYLLRAVVRGMDEKN